MCLGEAAFQSFSLWIWKGESRRDMRGPPGLYKDFSCQPCPSIVLQKMMAQCCEIKSAVSSHLSIFVTAENSSHNRKLIKMNRNSSAKANLIKAPESMAQVKVIFLSLTQTCKELTIKERGRKNEVTCKIALQACKLQDLL